MKFPRLSPVFTDLFQTALVSGFVLISSIYVTRLLAQRLGPDEFGVYSLTRRVTATILTFTTLGLTIALPRHLGFHSGAVEKQKSYILSGILLALLPVAILAFIFVSFPKLVSLILFGGVASKSLLYSTLTLLIGLTLHMVTYAIFRGKTQMKCANTLQLFNVSLLPLGAALSMAGHFSAPAILSAMGLGIITITLVPLIWQIIRSWGAPWLDLRKSAFELIIYGAPRVPANIGLALMFTLGPWLAVKWGGIQEAGYLVTGQAVLSLIEEMLTPLGLVLLPRLAQLSGGQHRHTLKGHISNLIGFSLHIGIFVSVQLFVFADWITLLWLGEAYRPAIPVMRIILASAGGYVLYTSLRSVIDADEVRAINTRNIWLALTISLVVAMILFAFNLSILALAVGLAIGVGVLGLNTLTYVQRKFALHWRGYYLGLALMLNLTMGLVAYGLKQSVQHSDLAWGYIIILELFFVTIYGIILDRKDVAWFQAIANRIGLRLRGTL